MSNVTELRSETRGFLAKLTSEFDKDVGCIVWTAEIHQDKAQGTEKVGYVIGFSREFALDRAKQFVEEFQKAEPSEPEWVRLS